MDHAYDMNGQCSSLPGVHVTPAATWVCRLLAMVGCCLLVSLGAQLKIPIPGTDVPITLQAFAVLLTGFALPAHLAASSMVLYLACGMAGMPVFAPGSAGVLGMTGGYLIGFVVAAWMVGRFKGAAGVGLFRLIAVAATGMAVIFFCGVTWRVVYWGGDWRFAVTTGFVPFVGSAIIVTLMSATSAWSLRLLKRS